MFKKRAPGLKIRSNPVLNETSDAQPVQLEKAGERTEEPAEPLETESLKDQPRSAGSCQTPGVVDRPRPAVTAQFPPMPSQPKITIAGTDSPVEYAGFARRAFALVLDQIFIIAAEWFFLSPAFLAILYSEYIGWALTFVIAISVAVMHYWIYTAFFEHSKWQATPGKFLVGLRVTDLKGNQLSFWRSTFRLMVQYVVSFMLTAGILLVVYVLTSKFSPSHKVDISPQTPLAYIAATIFGYCFVLFTQKRQTLFDKAAGRLVSFQPGYANSKQLTTWECFKASFAKLPTQAKLFLSIANPDSKFARTKLILAASLCMVACAWSFFAVFQIAQSIVIVESSIKAATADRVQPKTPIKKMDLVYDTLETLAHKLNLKELEIEVQDRALLYSKNITKVLNRAKSHIDAREFALAERALQIAVRIQKELKISSSDAETLSTSAYLAQAKGDMNSARTCALEALRRDPYNRIAIEILQQVDSKTFATYLHLKDITPVYQHSYIRTAQKGDAYFETAFYDPDENYLRRKLKECEQILAIMPDCTQALITETEVFTAQHKPKDALAIFEKTIAKTPDSAEAVSAYADFLSDSDNVSAQTAITKLRQLPASSQSANVHAKIAEILDMQAISIDDEKETIRLRQEAIAEWDKAIKLAPDQVEYYSEKGKLLGYLERTREAIEVYKQALSLDFEKQSKYSSMDSESGLRLSLASAFSTANEIENAEREFSILLTKNPNNPNIYESRAKMLFDHKRYEEAIPLLNRALSLKKGLAQTVNDKITNIFVNAFMREKKHQVEMSEINDSQIARLLHDRAEAYEGLGENRKAVADYTEALLLNNDYNPEPKKVAQLHIRLGTPDEAIKAYSIAITRDPHNWRLHLIQSALMEKIGRKEEAEKERQNAVRAAEHEVAQEQSDVNYFCLAQACVADKNYVKARDAINLALEKEAEDATYRIVLAKILVAQNQKKEALEIIRKENKENCECNLEDTARVLQACGQYKESLPPINKILKADAKNANAYYLRSQALANEGLRERAAQDLKKAQSLGYGTDPPLDLPF